MKPHTSWENWFQTIHFKRVFFGLLLSATLTGISYLPFFEWFIPGKSYSARSSLIQGIYLSGLTIFWFILAVLIWKNRQLLLRSPRWQAICQKAKIFFDQCNRFRPLTIFGWISVCLVGLALLAIHTRIIVYPYQMEYREGAIVLTNDAFLHGINPWKLENNPIYINVYGFVYNLVLLPFTWLLGNRVWIYRLGSFLAIIGQMVLLAKVLRKLGTSRLLILASLEFLWLGQIYYTTPLARPDSLGQLLFLATLIIPWLDRFSTKSLILSALFGWLGFYTKPYFILGVPLLAGYLFLFSSKKKALLYSLGIGVVLVISAVVVRIIFEAYFLNTIFSHWADTNQIFEYMIKQTIKFGRDYWSILLICLFGFTRYSLLNPTDWNKARINFRNINLPLTYFQPDYYLFILFINASLIFFSLGRHNGTIQAYYYQLLTPFLLVAVHQVAPRLHLTSGIGALLIGINLWTHGIENLKPDFVRYQTEPWERLSYYLDVSQHPLSTPNLTLMMMKKNKQVYDSGQFEYYYPYPEKDFFLYPPKENIQEVGDDFLIQRQEKLINQKFDTIFDESFYHIYYSKTSVLDTYKKIDTINLTMPHVFQKWQIEILKPE